MGSSGIQKNGFKMKSTYSMNLNASVAVMSWLRSLGSPTSERSWHLPILPGQKWSIAREAKFVQCESQNLRTCCAPKIKPLSFAPMHQNRQLSYPSWIAIARSTNIARFLCKLPIEPIFQNTWNIVKYKHMCFSFVLRCNEVNPTIGIQRVYRYTQ